MSKVFAVQNVDTGLYVCGERRDSVEPEWFTPYELRALPSDLHVGNGWRFVSRDLERDDVA